VIFDRPAAGARAIGKLPYCSKMFVLKVGIENLA
jgi:hypothetical protein